MNDIRAAINGDRGAPPRAAKRKAQDTLTQIHEDTTLSEEEENARRVVAPRKKKVVQRELKPGYCENCREKFDDFDEVCSCPLVIVLNEADLLLACPLPQASEVCLDPGELEGVG